MMEPATETPWKNPLLWGQLAFRHSNTSHAGKELAVSRTTVPTPQQHLGHTCFLSAVPANAFQGPG